MLLIFKALIGIAGVGAGVAVPVVVNKIQSSTVEIAEKASKVIKSINSGITERRENSKISEALRFLSDKKCKQFKNPASSNGSFGSFFACKEDSKDSFYYLDSEDGVKKGGANSAKKIKSVNYEKGVGDNAFLTLKLQEGGEDIKLSIPEQGGGGWSHFKNVDLSNDCKVIIPELGESKLNCVLKDSSKESSTSSYVFSIF